MSHDIDWGFPDNLKPYTIQINFVKALYKCIEEKKIGIFESPTGTGKSQSLLCGSLTWLKDHMSPFQNNNSEPNWIKEFKKRQESNLLSQVKKKQKISTLDTENHNHTISSLISQIDRVDYGDSSTIDHPQFKIYYCSRTHSQLTQVIHELAKTKHSNWARVIPLSSRKQTCINKDIIKQSNGSLTKLNDACIDMQSSCEFYYKRLDKSCDQDELTWQSFTRDSNILDIEDIVNLGKQSSICPYYASRDLQSNCHLVTLPYPLILQQSTREALGITDLSSSIVIFDEAHNLIDCIQNLFSVKLTRFQVNMALDQLNLYLSKYSSRISGSTTIHIQQLVMICNKYIKYFNTISKQSLYPNELLHKLELDNMNIFQLDSFVRQNRIAYKILGDCEDVPLLALLDFCIALAYSGKDGLITIDIQDDGSITLCYILLHCASRFIEIVEQSHCVILAGGTMAPINSFLFQLFDKLDDRLMHFSCSHVIPTSNLAVLVQPYGPSGSPITMTWQEQQSDDNMIIDVGRSISNYCRIIPNGLVVFFTSYSSKQLMLDIWRIHGIGFGNKTVFEEQESMSDGIESMLSLYKESAKSKGSILFAVMNGRLGEGINFSDESGRGVIVIGIPYPNIYASESIKARKKFIEDSHEECLYLDDISMRSVNQTIGRVIRHQNDYAVIILLDSRYSQAKLQERLPTWMREFVDQCPNFGYSMNRIRSFFARI